MPEQVVPIRQLADVGVILDTPPVSLPPNAFTNAKNVRFRDGAVRKMEGEVDIFESITNWLQDPANNVGELQYLAWWPSPNQAVNDSGYYVFVIENTSTEDTVHDVYAMLPGEQTAPTRIGMGFNRQGKWQHTLFNGGFTFILNNGIEKPQFITDPEGNTDISVLSLAELPGWDSYEVNELLLRDTFTDTSSRVFDTGQLRVTGVTQYVVTRTRAGTSTNLIEGTGAGQYTVTQENNLDVITFGSTAVEVNDIIQVNFQSVNPVEVRAAIVRAFGDFLVAGNLVERDTVTQGNPIVRRLTGVVRSSDVAQPGSIPANWNPFAAGVSTADEFVIADTGTVQDMVALQGNMYLYTNTSISAMRLTGNAQVPLAVQPVTDQYGALTTDSVLEYDGKHFVIGSDDIYLFGGHPGSIQSVSDARTRRSFFTRLNPINDNIRNLFTLRYAARDEIWICFPTVDSVRGESDEAYIWNYRNNTWTIRTLNSVVSGDVAPVPGGGIPSAIITLNGNSGTDDVIRVGSREVQTIDVAGTATVGHAESARPALFNFTALPQTEDTTPVPRPALELDAPELVEVNIGSDFYSGPNPAMQEYNILTIPDVQVGEFASGGVRFRIEYTRPEANTGNDNTMITVHANELTLPGTGNRTITGAQYAAALAPHLDSLPEFQDWTITADSNTINLLSDFAGMRELRGLEITTFTSTVNNITDTGPFTDETRVFTDSLGDELFTVTRSGEMGNYTYAVTTGRDTGFPDSDSITQLAFETDGNTFVAPDPFNRNSEAFTFSSTSGSYEIRSTPPANFVNLVRETDRIPDSGSISSATTTEDGVTVTRAEIEGGFLQTGDGDTTAEGVVVDVQEASASSNTNTAVVGNSSSVINPGNTYNYATANQFVPISTSIAGPPNYVRSYRTSDGTHVFNGCDTSSNSCHQSQAVTGWPVRPSDEVLRSWTHSAAAGQEITSIITNWPLGTIFNRPDGTSVERAYGGFGVEYANGVRLFFATSDTFNFFYGWSNQGANRGAGGIISSHAGNVRVEYGGNEQVTVASRNFQVTNNNPYPIQFNYQGGAQNVAIAANSSSSVLTGTAGSTDETWSWTSQPISFTGTSIGGTTTQDLTGTSGAATTTMNGVTVTSQNTSSPQTTTTATARRQGLVLPANNGASITNPATASYNPTREFQAIHWQNDNRAEFLAVYDLSTGARITGGGAHGRYNNPPSGWDNGFESGSFPVTPAITATNITNPVALGQVTTTVSVGVLNCGDDGCECISLQAVTARSNYGSNGVRQSGSATNRGPAIGVDARRGRAGFAWTRDSTGRSNECGGDLSGGVSFSGDFRVYADQDDPATGVRIILSGPNTTTTVTVPRASSETYTVNNTNPFPVVLTVAGNTFNIAADTSSTFTVTGSEGNSWTLASAPPTTNYQFTVTNNNARSLVSGTLTHAGTDTDLAGLAPGESVFGGLSTMSTATVTFVREVEQSGAMTVVTPANLMLVRSGVGTVPTDPMDLEAVRYNFSVNFTDSTPDISIDYQTPENRDPTASDNLTNTGAVQAFVNQLNGNTEFTTYFRTITNAEDPEVSTDTFRVEALAAPGNVIPDTTTTMPPHDALVFSTPVNQQNGGDADITVTSIQRGTVSEQGHEPITLTLHTGPRVPRSDGTFENTIADMHAVVINGSFPATDEGTRALNEVIRDSLRLDTEFNDIWNITTTGVNPEDIDLMSDNNGPHHLTVASVTPTESGLLTTHFRSRRDQQGTNAPAEPIYPSVTIAAPMGEDIPAFDIELIPPMSVTGRLTNVDIANIIRANINVPGWTVISADDTNIGTAPAANQIRIVRDDRAVVDSGSDQTMGWRVENVTYGNIGNTLPGMAESSDGDEVGRLNTSDFARANIMGRVGPNGGVPGNTLVTALGTGNRLDFRGSRTERSQPTRVMVAITNPDVTSMDPVFNPDGTLMMMDGNVALVEGNTQYIPLVFGEAGDYNPSDQTGTQPGAHVDASTMVSRIESAINSANRRVQTDLAGNTLTVIPSQYSGLANFVLDIFLNDTDQNVARWNAIVAANVATQERLTGREINTLDFGGIQSTVPTPVDSGTDEQFNPGTRVPNFADQNVVTTGLTTNVSNINTTFDPLRPWPTTQVNLNREFPVFANSILNSDTGDLSQTFRGADLGFLYLNDQYESFIERIELGLTPEFDTEQLTSLALWGDGGNATTFNQPIDQATLTVKMYGTNAPGETRGGFSNDSRNNVGMLQRTTDNDFVIGSDYKIDMRVHGRFINYLITDYDVVDNVRVAREANLQNQQGVTWNISGIQADIMKGGRR